ncbi:kinetochore protein Spc24 [Hippocampus zosterae]|uniref:kinetochore protein Spc24 n=1 Tax=Hippocampus zosterae TaxID=109293 RepID=UPI00223E4400|nr:kinetochore protein Spc24 [Hippocampus zosterae]
MLMDKFQDFQESLDTLLDLTSSQPETLTRMRNEQQAFFDRDMATRGTVTQIFKDVVQQEESLVHRFTDTKEKQLQEKELESLEDQLRKFTAKSQLLDSDLQFLQSELERLRSSEKELAALQNEVDEDTTEIIPSAIYVVRLNHLITRIKWEYDTEPHTLKAVHYGPDVATPISIDTKVKSQREIADQLWNFVSDEW